MRSAGYSTELAKATAATCATGRRLEVGRRGREGSVWSDYRDNVLLRRCRRRDQGEFVRAALAEGDPASCSTWAPTTASTRCSRPSTPATWSRSTGDEQVVDRLYRRLRPRAGRTFCRGHGPGDPSGGIGWRNRERRAFAERGAARCHAWPWRWSTTLAIGANVPLPEVVGWLASFGGRLVVELPHPRGPHGPSPAGGKAPGPVRRLPAGRVPGAAGRALPRAPPETLPGGTRTLYLAEPKP
jgi:hypothetical protein